MFDLSLEPSSGQGFLRLLLVEIDPRLLTGIAYFVFRIVYVRAEYEIRGRQYAGLLCRRIYCSDSVRGALHYIPELYHADDSYRRH